MGAWRATVLGALIGLLTSCDDATRTLEPVAAIDRSVARPAQGPVEPSDASRALSQHYARVQADLLGRGLLRRDGGGPDVPFSARMLTENFVRIALYDEYISDQGRLIERQTASRLHRWDRPVRLSLYFGDSVPAAQRSKDTGAVASYVRRLSRVTGHPIRLGDQGNFAVLVLNENERTNVGPILQEIAPEIDDSDIRLIETLPRDIFCVVMAFKDPQAGVYSRAIALIRGEHPDLLRLSCLHEEIAQGLGLANDSPAARPSIFNDDEEFGLLTTHDEFLLRMLYDNRLKAGMDEAEARPIAARIASELVDDSAS